jgi:hypothetical protein
MDEAELQTEGAGATGLPGRTNVSLATRHWGLLSYSDQVEHPQVPVVECENLWVLDVAGQDQTDGNGRATFSLRNEMCDGIRDIAEPVYAVATPDTNVPNYVTIRASVVDLPGPGAPDVRVTVFSWGPGGNPRPRVLFFWRVIVRGNFPSDVEGPPAPDQ